MFRRRPPVSGPLLAALHITGPRGERRDLPLSGTAQVTFGREAPASCVLADPGVSRRHAQLSALDGGGWQIADLGSVNGTFVNGEPVRGGRVLEPGDEIEIGPYRLVARPPESGATVQLRIRSRARTRRRATVAGIAAGTVAAAAVVAAGVATVVSRDDTPSPTPVAQVTVTPPPAESQQITEAVRKVRPAVVRIRTRTSDGGGVGSGVFVEDGVIITNEHVVRGDPRPMVLLADGRTVQGTVHGTDAQVDLAVVRIAETGQPVAVLGDSDALELGERLIAIGFPLGASAFTSDEPSITSGIFSAKREFRGRTYVQTDTPINHGNSGGPLINLKGEVIGINTLVVGRTVEQQGQGLNLAIPSTAVRSLLPGLRDQPAARVSVTPTRTATAATGTLTYRSTSFGYRLQYPGSWTLTESDPRQVAVSGEGGEVAVVVQDVSSGTTLAAFASDVIDRMSRRLTDFTVSRRRDGKLPGGQPAVVLSVTWKDGGESYEGTEVIAVNAGRGYVMLGGASTQRYASVSARVEDILNSFTLQ